MNAKTVKLATLRELVEAGSVRSAAIVGLPGGYAVRVRYGMSDRALAARTGDVRIFSKIDGAAKTLRELGVVKAELDTSGYSPRSVLSKQRPDRTQALKDAHKASQHDKWFRDQVELAVTEADSPDAEWHEHEAMFDTLELEADVASRAPTTL
jgi:hypothetical protein